MRIVRFLFLAIIWLLNGAAAIADRFPDHSVRDKEQNFKLPVRFEENAGQAPKRVDYIGRGGGFTTLLGDSRVSLRFRTGIGASEVAIRPSGARRGVRFHAEGEKISEANYLLGADRTSWRLSIPVFGRVTAHKVYTGIDWTFYSEDDKLKYDFRIDAGADPGAIKLDFEGVMRLSLDTNGDLLLLTQAGGLRQGRPVAYQKKGDHQITIPVAFQIEGEAAVRFRLGEYDRSAPLVIDPAFLYGTYLGGDGTDEARGVATDSAGAIYLAGTTESANFPTASSLDGSFNGARDVFVTKVAASGGTILYSTYIGGSGHDEARGIALGIDGSAVVTGTTSSSNFPVSNAYDGTWNGGDDAFLLKLTPAGSALTYSTYFGGTSNDWPYAIAVDGTGAVILTGETGPGLTFPLKKALQTTANQFLAKAFVTKFTPAGNALEFSTFLSGDGSSRGRTIALGNDNSIYIAGSQYSYNFPLLNPLDTRFTSEGGFVARLTTEGALAYSTYFPAEVAKIRIDAEGSIYLSGATSPDMPASMISFGGRGCYAAKLNAVGSAYVFLTNVGGQGLEECYSMAVTATGEVWIAGTTQSGDFPLVNPADGSSDIYDMFLSRISADGTTLEDSTYIGGGGYLKIPYEMAMDSEGRLLMAGTAGGPIPLTSGAIAAGPRGLTDAFLLRMGGTVSRAPVTFLSVPAGLSIRTNEGGGRNAGDAELARGKPSSGVRRFPTVPERVGIHLCILEQRATGQLHPYDADRRGDSDGNVYGHGLHLSGNTFSRHGGPGGSRDRIHGHNAGGMPVDREVERAMDAAIGIQRLHLRELRSRCVFREWENWNLSRCGTADHDHAGLGTPTGDHHELALLQQPG